MSTLMRHSSRQRETRNGLSAVGLTSYTNRPRNRHRYCGKEKDSESGLYYYGARYYESWTCRFVSVDPLAERYAQLSSYNYADNCPISELDVDGMQNPDSTQTPQSGADSTKGKNAELLKVREKANISSELEKIYNNQKLDQDKFSPGVPCYQAASDRSIEAINAVLNQGNTSQEPKRPSETKQTKKEFTPKGKYFKQLSSVSLSQIKDEGIKKAFGPYGLGGAFQAEGLGVAVSESDVWSGKLTNFSLIQMWDSFNDLSDAMNGKSGDGHSVIFVGYIYAVEGDPKSGIVGLKVWDQGYLNNEGGIMPGALIKGDWDPKTGLITPNAMSKNIYPSTPHVDANGRITYTISGHHIDAAENSNDKPGNIIIRSTRFQ